MLHLGCADAKAERAQRAVAAVWLSPQTTVVPGSVKPRSGPTTWTMPCSAASASMNSTRTRGCCGVERIELLRRLRIGDRRRDPLRVRPRRGGQVMVRHRKRQIGAAHRTTGRAKAIEGLRARHLMDEVAVDVEESGAVFALRDDMRVPDLLVEGAGGGIRLT